VNALKQVRNRVQSILPAPCHEKKWRHLGSPGWHQMAGSRTIMLWDSSTDVNKLPIVADLARRAATLRPDVASNWETLARTLLRAGRDEEAIDVLTQAISHVPAEPKLHLMLADVHCRSGRLAQSKEALQHVPPIPAKDREMTVLHLELLMRTR